MAGPDIQQGSATSEVLGEAIEYLLYRPPVIEGTTRLPVVYLFHGRGGSMADVSPVLANLDTSIREATLPPLMVVAPDAVWSDRASWYVDSRFSGSPPGRPVETALVRDLVDHIDATQPTIAHRVRRIVAGVSMGGAGALRFAIAHPDRFAAAICLSPAVYDPLPPTDSTIPGSVAFGHGEISFDPTVYEELSYRRLLASFGPSHPVRLWVGVGNSDSLQPEAVALVRAARVVPGVDASLHVVDGGHDWATWSPMLEAALRELLGSMVASGAAP